MGLVSFLNEWFNDDPVITVHTSCSTGHLKRIACSQRSDDTECTPDCEFLDLKQGETALLCMNLRYIRAMMVIVRSLIAGLNLIVRRLPVIHWQMWTLLWVCGYGAFAGV